jgi:hypothetical protein
MDGVRAVGWATGISKVYTALVRRTYMEVGRHGVQTSLRGGKESKVLETLHADCGLGYRYQRGIYCKCKMYVHGRGVVTGSETACEKGEESKVLTSRGTPRTGCGLGNRHQQSVYRTGNNTYMQGGRHGF